MPISEEQLETYARFFKAHFDRVGREGSYEPPPSDISSNAPCTPTGLLTPSREDHGVARPTRAEPKRESRPVKIATTEDTSVEQFRQWLAALPRSPPEFFPRLDAADDYIFMNPGMEFDWHARSSRSKVWKEPYLFALNAAGEATIASLGEDSRPTSISPEVHPIPTKRASSSKAKPTGVTKSTLRRKDGNRNQKKRRVVRP